VKCVLSKCGGLFWYVFLLLKLSTMKFIMKFETAICQERQSLDLAFQRDTSVMEGNVLLFILSHEIAVF
jgi:hypothetical protein